MNGLYYRNVHSFMVLYHNTNYDIKKHLNIHVSQLSVYNCMISTTLQEYLNSKYTISRKSTLRNKIITYINWLTS